MLLLLIVVLVAIGFVLMVKARSARRNRRVLVGEARKIQWRLEHGSAPEKTVDVCTFRLERFGPDGVPLQPVTVEMSSRSGFAGDLTEGDRVAVYDYRGPSGAVVTSAVRNLSTGGIFGDRKKINRGDVPESHN